MEGGGLYRGHWIKRLRPPVGTRYLRGTDKWEYKLRYGLPTQRTGRGEEGSRKGESLIKKKALMTLTGHFSLHLPVCQNQRCRRKERSHRSGRDPRCRSSKRT